MSYAGARGGRTGDAGALLQRVADRFPEQSSADRLGGSDDAGTRLAGGRQSMPGARCGRDRSL